MKKHFRKEIVFLLLLLLALGVVAQTTQSRQPSQYDQFCTIKDPVTGRMEGVGYDHGPDGHDGDTGDYEFFVFNNGTGQWESVGTGGYLDGVSEQSLQNNYNCTP